MEENHQENNDLYFVDVPQISDAELDEKDDNFPGRLPAPPVPNEDNTDVTTEPPTNDASGEASNNVGLFTELEDQPMVNTKKKKKSHAKLDPKRLTSARGLPALEQMARSLKFKGGDNNQYDNLNALMSKLEHWAHRLYPKYKFDDTLEKIETLGKKGEVRYALSRMRLGKEMPLNDVLEGDVGNKDEDSEIEYDETEPENPSASFVSLYGASLANGND